MHKANKLSLDFETRSIVDLLKRGSYNYATHPSTEVICLSVKVDEEPSRLWPAPKFREIIPEEWCDTLPLIDIKKVWALIEEAEIIEAHNAQFEEYIWDFICNKRMTWPPLPIAKLRCSLAKAAMHGLPTNLDGAAKALNASQKKDTEGHKIMLALSKPRSPLKADKEALLNNGSKLDQYIANQALAAYDKAGSQKAGAYYRWLEIYWNWILKQGANPNAFIFWNEDPALYYKLFKYCLQDTETEHAISSIMYDLPRQEYPIWVLDQQINKRGVCVDIKAATDAINMVNKHTKKLLDKTKELTNGEVESPKQVAALLAWMEKQGTVLPNLQKETVAEALENPDPFSLPHAVRELLEIRQSLGKSSTAKYAELIMSAGGDGRVHNLFAYHAASTGRWAGRGVQPQNLPRGRIKLNTDEKIEAALDAMAQGPDMVEFLYGDPMELASSAIRGTLMAAPGHELLASDFSAVEGRVLAWLAGEQHILDAYTRGLDLYKIAASGILGVPYDEITKNQRQTPGKIAELACGYQGSVGAIRQFGGGKGMLDKEVKEKIVDPWRANRPATVRFWYSAEEAALLAALRPGQVFKVGKIAYKVQGDYLLCKLPSGRCLFYYQPQVQNKLKFGQEKPVLTYMGMRQIQGRTTREWTRVDTYGGKLVENIVQAVAADLLRSAMLRVARRGVPIVMHIHDEIVGEVPPGSFDLAEYNEIVGAVPQWAYDLPMKANGWAGRRYRKE